ncbi:hypothetical protein ONZ45_g912 [Pleurotus djamor]|nr:hypothetical protein ONZ45_g912 [Pleurotus djamor]
MKGYLSFLYTLFTTHTLLVSLASASDLSHGSYFSHNHRRVGRALQSRTESQDPATVSVSVSLGASLNGPTSTPDNSTTPAAPVAEDPEVQTLCSRRTVDIIATLSTGAYVERISTLATWLPTLTTEGKWPDVDYTTGCTARRASWPAQEHWRRIVVLAGVLHGGIEGAEQYASLNIKASITLAMDFWFSNDFANPACVDQGGKEACPCDTPGLWNQNWFANTILIPELSTQACLLLGDALSPIHLDHCSRIALRSYDTFTRKPDFLTGANALDVAKIGIDQALLTKDASLLTDAYQRVHKELVIQTEVGADGIFADGSFMQHDGILYNGNYGKDFVNDLLAFELQAAGTQFAASHEGQLVLETLFKGNLWMIYRNTITGVNHWDFSSLARFISLPVSEDQATSSIKISLSDAHKLGEQWKSQVLTKFAEDLWQTSDTANAAKLEGNKMFFAGDFMVHRGQNYVTSVKMYSSRTINTECTNSQNNLGFHLSDGAVYTRVKGNEYEDIAAAWNWNLIPGTTVDYAATPLTCDSAKAKGVEAFVGGCSTGKLGIAVMRYTNPRNETLKWQKSWFFLPGDVQHVMVSGIKSSTDAPVYTVLDQRIHTGDVEINDVSVGQGAHTEAAAQSLWHGDVGYLFPSSNGTFQLQVNVSEHTGNWSAIGTSSKPPSSVDLFSASLHHQDLSASISYTTFPGVDKKTFKEKCQSTKLQTIQNDEHVSAVYDAENDVIMVVFWDVEGGSVTVKPDGKAPITITSDGSVPVIFNHRTGKCTVSDPSHKLERVRITIEEEKKLKHSPLTKTQKKKLVFSLPTGGVAGGSVSKSTRSKCGRKP